MKALIDECEVTLLDDYDEVSQEDYIRVKSLLEYLQLKIGGKEKIKVTIKRAFESIERLMYIHHEKITQDDYDRAIDGGLTAVRLGCGWAVDAFELTPNIPGHEFEWAALKSLPNVLTTNSEPFEQLKVNLGREPTLEEIENAIRFSEELVKSFKANGGKMSQW